MIEKLCIFCKHFDWESIHDFQYSEMTSGTDGGASCLKHRYWERRPDSAEELRELFLLAESCDDYERP